MHIDSVTALHAEYSESVINITLMTIRSDLILKYKNELSGN